MPRSLRALALALLLPAAAFGGDKREAVMDLLNAYEETATPAQLAALGEGVDQELMEIAVDGEVPSSRRGRALTALQHYPTDAVRSFLEGQLASGDKSLFRRKAAWSLAVGWSNAVVPTLGEALGDDDVQLRLAVAQALGSIETPEAREALQARLGDEPEPAVREAIQTSLGQE